jgi:HlyD family secretion protein
MTGSAPSLRERVGKRKLLALGIVAAASVLLALFWNRAPRVQNFTARVSRGDIHDVVEATGTINAVITVQVGSQVSGTIAKLNADFNSRVRKGDVIALIDPALFQGAVLQASADLENARANLSAARANLEKARASAVQAKAEYQRTDALFRDTIASQQLLDLAKANDEGAAASVTGAAANVTQADAQVSQKAAALSVAQTNLNYTVIRSPIDGTVVARNVDVGQTVAASLQAPTIFTIAQDLTKMLVYAKTDESDVGNIRPGRPVSFKVDAFPKDTFHGVVSQVRMNATMVQSVVTYDTIVEFENPELKLFPGMTAYVTIPVATATAALKVPNTALRYKPPLSREEILALFKRFGVDGMEAAPGSAADGDEGGRPQAAPRGDEGVVWRLHRDGTIEPLKLSLGITDHSFTEVTKVGRGELKEGDELVVRSIVPKSQAPGPIRR